MTEQKEMTAPVASVDADAEQSLNVITNDSIPKNLEYFNTLSKKDEFDEFESYFRRVNDPNFLNTITMTELYDTVYAPRTPIISDLLYPGTYLFAGAPKVGKSFFMAQLGYHISTGLPLWDRPVRKGTVLYLALEDDYARLQSRLSRMYGVESADNFHFATVAKKVGGGLDGQLDKFVGEHPTTRLIIIDTLQKIREVGGEKYSYASDYEIITQLKQFSDHNGICILLVHHTRKQEADDCFDTISGTNGLLGASDGAFLIQKDKRTEDKAILEVVGRDQQEQRLHLQFNHEQCIWELIEAETELWKEPPDEVLEKVVALVNAESPEWIGTASDLIEVLQLDLQPNILTRRLNVGAGRLFNEHGIRYESSRSHDGRKVKLTLEANISA